MSRRTSAPAKRRMPATRCRQAIGIHASGTPFAAELIGLANPVSQLFDLSDGTSNDDLHLGVLPRGASHCPARRRGRHGRRRSAAGRPGRQLHCRVAALVPLETGLSGLPDLGGDAWSDSARPVMDVPRQRTIGDQRGVSQQADFLARRPGPGLVLFVVTMASGRGGGLGRPGAAPAPVSL